jgi:hypothetical protein
LGSVYEPVTFGADRKLVNVMKFLTAIKLTVVFGIAETLTVLSFNFAYFETIKAEISYGIWHGFPFGYYFNGMFLDHSNGGPLPNWLPLNFWVIHNWVFDFIIWFILVGSVLFLIEFLLKKLLKVDF